MKDAKIILFRLLEVDDEIFNGSPILKLLHVPYVILTLFDIRLGIGRIFLKDFNLEIKAL
jgi:hypothetical protein